MTLTTKQRGKKAEVLKQDATPKEILIIRGLASLPAIYRFPEVVPTLDEAQAYCKRLAQSHYENFHVASWFLPNRVRPHFHAISAYYRISHDLSDKIDDTAVALAMLDLWEEELDACYKGRVHHPVFVALAETIQACSIPKEPFADLLTAFRHDQKVMRYATMEDLLAYCRYSANPLGRLVLYATGGADEERFRLTDATCTALQLANFWQDVREDYARGRVYLPQQDMEFFHVSDEIIAEGIATPEFRGLMRCEVEFTRGLFEEGLPLIGMADHELAPNLDLLSRGGLEILRAIEGQNYDVLSARQTISNSTKVGLAVWEVAKWALENTGSALSRVIMNRLRME
ncbi:MAG: squalene synthase HpnC [Terracidiphilus sp.]|jgi:squalene synthase HpnC